MLRLFVAVELPSEIRAALQSVIDRLKAAGAEGGIRYSKPENIHLTLKFLGAVPEDQVPEMTSALRARLTGLRPFEIKPTSLGTFGRGSDVRVCWVGVGGEVGRLRDLVERVEAAVNPLGYPREDRPYSPHLTLARSQRSADRPQKERLLGAIEVASPLEFPSFVVGEVCLIQSIPWPEGSHYSVLRRFPIG